MGCSTSIDNQKLPVTEVNTPPVKEFSFRPRQHKPDIISFDDYGKTKKLSELTYEDREHIRETWKYMEPNMTANGVGIFKRIFAYSPEVKVLFEVSHVNDDAIGEHPVIKGHASRFMNAVGASVDNLDHLEDTLTHILFNLGKQHKTFRGFDSDYFDTFYMAMTAQWETVMGGKFTREVANAWAHLFSFMMEKLKEGYFSRNP